MGRNLAGDRSIGIAAPKNPSAKKEPTRNLATQKGTPQRQTLTPRRGTASERAETVQRQQLGAMGVDRQSAQLDTYRQQDYSREDRDIESGFTGMQALFEGKPEAVQDWKNVASNLVRMREAGVEDETVDFLMHAGGADLQPHISAIAGEDWWDKNYTPPPPPESSWWKDAAGQAFRVLDSAQQRLVAGSMLGIQAALDTGDEVSAAEGLWHALKQPTLTVAEIASGGNIEPQAAYEITRFGRPNVSADQDKSGDLNLRESLGLEAQSGGAWGDVFDWTFRLATDPLNAVGGVAGKAKVAKTGIVKGASVVQKALRAERAAVTAADDILRLEGAMRQATKQNARRLVQKIDIGGMKSLTPDERSLATLFLSEWGREVAEKTGRKNLRKPFGLFGGQERVTAHMAALERSGQQGIHLFGRTVLPTRAGAVGRARAATGLGRGRTIYKVTPEAERAASEAVQNLDETIQAGPRKTVEMFGEKVDIPKINISHHVVDDGITLVDAGGVEHFLNNRDGRQLFALLDDAEVAAIVKHSDDPPPAEVLQRLALPAGEEGAERIDSIREILDGEQFFWGHADRQAREAGRFTAGRTGSELQLGRATDERFIDEGLGGRPALGPATTAPRRTPGEARQFLGRAGQRLGRPARGEVGSVRTPRDMPVKSNGVPEGMEMVPYRGSLEVPNPDNFADKRNWRMWADEAIEYVDVTEDLDPHYIDRGNGLRPMLEAAPDELIDETVDLLGNLSGKLENPEAWLGMAERNLAEWTAIRFEKGAIGSLLDVKIAGMRPFRRLARAMGPFSVLKATIGPEAAEDVRRLMSEGRELHEYEHLLTRIGMDSSVFGQKSLLKDAITEFGDEEGLMRHLNEVLSDVDRVDEVLAAGGKLADDASKVDQLIYTLDQARREIRAAAIRGGADPDLLHDIDTYLPRVLTQAARKHTGIADNVGGAAADVSQAGRDTRLGDGFLKERTVATELDDLYAVNDEVKTLLGEMGVEGIDEIDEIFTTNIPAAFATRGKSAFQAAADVDLLEGIARLEGFDGAMLGYRIPAGEAHGPWLTRVGQKPGQYSIKTLPNGEAFAIHKDIAEEMADVRRIFGDPKELNKFTEFFDKMNNVWAGWATVPRPAFHARNFRSNIFLAYQGGLNSVAPYKWAREAAKLDRAAMDLSRSKGIPYREALQQAAKGDPRMANIVMDAQRLGVMDGGQGVDILKTHIGEDPAESLKHSTANPLNPGNKAIQTGREVAQRVENNARLALFYDQIQKGVPVEDAAAHVKKFLFDYGELTGFESQYVRRVARFYTFARKNVALQLEMMAKYPARTRRAQMVNEAVAGTVFTGEPGEDDGSVMPPWFRNMPGMSRRTFNGETVALNTDTPFNQFLQMAQVFGDGLAMLPGVDPDRGTPLDDQSDADRFFEGLFGQFSGVGPGVMDFIQEQRTGQDAFSGRRLVETGFWDFFNKDSGSARFAEVFMPILGEAHRQGERWAGDEDDRRSHAVNIMNTFFGISMMPLEETGRDREVQSMLYDLENMIQEWNKENPNERVPTLADLRAEGKIQMQDRLAEAVLYSWEENEDGTLSWSEEVYDDRILNMIPKAVRTALGLPEPGSRSGSSAGEHVEMDDIEWDTEMSRQAIIALDHWFQERHGREMTEAERLDVFLTLPGAPGNEYLEEQGIEAWRDPAKNRFLPDAPEEDRTAENEARLNAIAEAVGLNPATISALRPLQQELDRALAEGARAGLSPEEVVAQMSLAKDEGGVGGLSRVWRAYLNQLAGGTAMDGPWNITANRTPVFGDEEEEKAMRKAAQAEHTIRTLWAINGLGVPSDETVRTFVYNVIMTGPELDYMGYDNLRGARNRVDIRSDEQKDLDIRREAAAANAGVGLLP